MVLAWAFADWLKTFDRSDWTLVLTVVMIVLTGAIFVLTWLMVMLTRAVKRYAAQTLEVTQQSLDLFSTPNVTIDGGGEFTGPFGGDNSSVVWMTTAQVMLTVCNNSPLEILIQRSDIKFDTMPEESSDPDRARGFAAQEPRLWGGGRIAEGLSVVENTLPLKLAVRGRPPEEGEPPLRLVTEFRIESYLYRGKPREPVVARCAFVIGPPR
ncbi:MAG TPA: hypothetical protein VM238_07155 [Phycisphaerae bacterium]|nr:hypothetical protein [Phycisphaerae bacterium]